MHLSLFEAGMLLCFGAAWPVNILKSIRSKTTKGKSLLFLFIVNLGYISGITHKLLYSRDIVLVLYLLNFTMVSVDIGLYFYNRAREKKLSESPDFAK